jgi:glucose dehydrogenase
MKYQEKGTDNVCTIGIRGAGPTTDTLLLLGAGAMVMLSISAVPQAYAAVDKFGVEMAYPTKTGGEQWFMNMVNPTSDSRFDPKTTLTKNTDGSWKVKSDAVRMNVFTSTGYDQDNIATYNQKPLQQKDTCNHQMTGRILR